MSAGTLLTHPATPGFQAIRWFLRSALARTRSPFSYVEQVYNWGGQMRGAEIDLPPMSPATAKLWIAFFHDLNGPEGTFYLSDTVGVESRWASGTLDATARTVSSVSTGLDTLTFGADHDFLADVRVRVSSTTSDPPAGLAEDTNYFVILTDPDEIQLAATPGGSAIDITDVGSGTITVTPYNVGDSIFCKSLDTSVDNYFAGEMISIADRLHTIRADVTANAGGYALASIWPAVASDQGAADIDAGTDARGVFRLDEWPEYGWSVERLATGTKLIAMEVL